MNHRPLPADRKFTSEAVERTITEIKKTVKDEELALLFENCFSNTLDTTVNFSSDNGKPDTFVITGDINAMWLRDSTAQVSVYLPFVNEDSGLKEMIKGVINRHARCILTDPYANAFNDGKSVSEWKNDITDMKPGVHERKWEIDSLCYPVKLAYNYWKFTGDISCFDEDWKNSAKLILKTLRQQQRKTGRGDYRFGRVTAWSTDTVPGNGYGNPVNPNGLVVSIFRPSDDATIFPFLIPSNFFLVTSLEQLSEIFKNALADDDFAAECLLLASEIKNALEEHAVTGHRYCGKIYAYEADGMGNRLCMDDANIPSLLSLPYLGCCSIEDEVYLNTRRFILSKYNPYFFEGSAAEGIGSPHTLIDNIWPMSIIMRAMTSVRDEEIIKCLKYLKSAHAGTGFMHESFNKNNVKEYTRDWFAWANSLFGELILKLYNEKPDLLRIIN
ncbi:MAG: glycoside hydrolase family 125 protein [Ignavibacteriaceae bacterium]